MRVPGPHLALVLPGVPRAGGAVWLSDKTWSGLEALRSRWPGELSVVARPVDQDEGANLGMASYDPDDLPWRLVLDDPVTAVTDLQPDVVQLPLHLSVRPLVSRVASVVVAENPARERFRYAASTAPRGHLPRIALGAVRQAVALRQMVGRTAAVACNGWAAWDAYRTVGRGVVEPLLFFDTRLPLARVEEASRRLAGRPGRHAPPLRMAFSGRIHPAKGIHLAVAASAELDRRGCAHSLAVLGEGPDRPRLEAISGPSVAWLGELAFDPQWIEHVAAHVDVMVLPHVQGDPSGTYLEAAGLGVPVVGVPNAALAGHTVHGGFAVAARNRSAGALADALEELARDPARRHALGAAGVEFMRQHAAEPTFDARAEQLLAVAGATR